MRTVCAAGLALALGAVAVADPPKATPLDGYWKPQMVEFDGKHEIDAKTGAALTLVVKDGEYRAYYCTDPAKDLHFRLFTADLTLDPAAGTFELAVKDGQKKGERRHGVYSLSGNTLRLCYGPADKPRPTTFAAPKGSGLFHEVWAMEKK